MVPLTIQLISYPTEMTYYSVETQILVLLSITRLQHQLEVNLHTGSQLFKHLVRLKNDSEKKFTRAFHQFLDQAPTRTNSHQSNQTYKQEESKVEIAKSRKLHRVQYLSRILVDTQRK